MKKIICLIGVILTFALACAFITSCGEAAQTTVPTIPGLSSTGTTETADTTTETIGGTTDASFTTASSAITSGTEETTVTTDTTGTTTGTTATTKATTATTVTPKNITIFLDPGHGGKDPGVVGTYGGIDYYEKDITLAVALQAKKELEKRGYTVVMSRETDVTVGLEDRAPMAQDADAAMFISIHVNSFGDTSVHGLDFFYTGREGLEYDGRKFATYFKDEFAEMLELPLSTNPDKLAYPNMKIRGVKVDESLYGSGKYLAVLAATEIPSVLIELGYITNANDFAMLNSPWWQIFAGRAVADAVDAAYADGVYAK